MISLHTNWIHAIIVWDILESLVLIFAFMTFCQLVIKSVFTYCCVWWGEIIAKRDIYRTTGINKKSGSTIQNNRHTNFFVYYKDAIPHKRQAITKDQNHSLHPDFHTNVRPLQKIKTILYILISTQTSGHYKRSKPFFTSWFPHKRQAITKDQNHSLHPDFHTNVRPLQKIKTILYILISTQTSGHYKRSKPFFTSWFPHKRQAITKDQNHSLHPDFHTNVRPLQKIKTILYILISTQTSGHYKRSKPFFTSWFPHKRQAITKDQNHSLHPDFHTNVRPLQKIKDQKPFFTSWFPHKRQAITKDQNHSLHPDFHTNVRPLQKIKTILYILISTQTSGHYKRSKPFFTSWFPHKRQAITKDQNHSLHPDFHTNVRPLQKIKTILYILISTQTSGHYKRSKPFFTSWFPHKRQAISKDQSHSLHPDFHENAIGKNGRIRMPDCSSKRYLNSSVPQAIPMLNSIAIRWTVLLLHININNAMTLFLISYQVLLYWRLLEMLQLLLVVLC